MKFTFATIVAAAAFLPSISAHLIMSNPKQWFVPQKVGPSVELSDGQQNPLQADGSNFPCHGVPPEEPVATYQPGSTQPLQILGTAVHGGGSGQMSITYDTRPTRNTKFRVMTSFQGNHPVTAPGNLDEALGIFNPLPQLSFRVPANLPAGRAVVAWTWFNRFGNREMYMKCATVTIGGSVTSTAAFDALPEMLRANSGNGCTVPEGINAISFKNPGPQVFGTGITPIACDNTQPGSGNGTPPPTSSSTQILIPVPTTIVTRVSSTVPISTPVFPIGAPAPPAPPAPPVITNAPGGCVEGSIICNSASTFSLCSGGLPIFMGSVAPGTKCTNGQILGLKLKRDSAVRFSHEHRRRHQHN